MTKLSPNSYQRVSIAERANALLHGWTLSAAEMRRNQLIQSCGLSFRCHQEGRLLRKNKASNTHNAKEDDVVASVIKFVR